MLILTRRIGEKLVVGGNVVVTVLGVKGNQISVGIEAPPEIKIHREEIFEKIKAKQNKTPVVLKSRKALDLKEKATPVTKKRETLVLKNRKKIIGL